MNHLRKFIVLREPVLFMLAFLLFLTATTAQDSGKLKDYQLLSKKLLLHEGKWLAENLNYMPADSNSAKWIRYEFLQGVHPNTLQLHVQGYHPAKSQWKSMQLLQFAWNAAKQNLEIWGTDQFGNVYKGEAGRITANDFNFDLMDPTVTSTPSFLRYNQTVSDTMLALSYYQQQADKWVFKEKLELKPFPQAKGKLSFMSTRDGNFEIYQVEINGQNLKNLSCNKSTDYAFSHLPNNDIFFYSDRDGNNEIYLMSADGKRTVNLTNHTASDRLPFVSPDGKKVLFVSDRDHRQGEIYSMDIDGKNVHRLTTNEYFEDAAQWSPDGASVIFTRELRDLKDTSAKAPTNGEIFIMNADGSNQKQLTNRAGWDGGADFSPDGKKIVFYGKSAKGKYDLFVMDADGKNLLNITEDDMEDYSPDWSADGNWIAFTGGDSKNYEVYILHLPTKIKLKVTNHPRRDESPIWQR